MLGKVAALFGSPLKGDSLVRFIYLDEAGISAHEPVTVVAGIIVHADTEWRLAEQGMNEVLEAVPERYRDGFIFHATSIWSDPKLREGWSKDDRLGLLHAMMALPRKLNIPITLGMVSEESKEQSRWLASRAV